MKTYDVKITDYALEQMQETVNYITHRLASPDTARKWLDNMKKRIASLSQIPTRIKLVDEEPWHNEGVHKMIVNNFLVYFYIDEESTVVWIIAVVYSGMNQIAQLDQMEFWR